MKKDIYKGSLIQDIGMLVFLAALFGSVLIVGLSGSNQLLENAVMLIGIFFSIISVVFGSVGIALAGSATQILLYTIYKLFNLYAYGTPIASSSFFWLVLPLGATGAMIVFYEGRKQLQLENEILSRRVEELATIDPLTGLYNLKSFYHDIYMQIKYAQRKGFPLTLMIIRLRHKEELQKIFTKREFDHIKQKLAEIVQDCIRIEDRLYSIDEQGGLAVVLTCDEKGASIIHQRIHARVGEKTAFEGISKSAIRAEVQLAFLEYKESYKDIMSYKEMVEGELQYDV